MFGVDSIIGKLNTAINSGTLSELELAQAFGAIESIENHGISSVDTPNDLPNPVTNRGRFIFIESETRYVFSNGIMWDINYVLKPEYVNLYAWGSNTAGQLGDNTTINRSSPVSVVGGFTDWISASGGESHSIGIRANGTLWSWGYNTAGQLGDNTTITKSSPVSVVGGFTDWIQVSAGGSTQGGSPVPSFGLRANGTLWSWGSGNFGRLGNNSVENRSSPVSVVGGFTDWIQVSAGTNHCMALRANGTLWGWGANSGTIGDGTITSRSSPVSVVGGFTDWIQISAGNAHNIALRVNGTAWAWGRANGMANPGLLGDGEAIDRSSPVSVIGGFTDWIQVDAGRHHSMALRSNGTAWAWGYNGSGRLGAGSANLSTSSPVSVVGGFTDWIQVGAGGDSSLGLRANGTLWGWGGGISNGLAGDNTVIRRSSPVSVVGGFTDWVLISSTQSDSTHVFAIRG